MHPVPVFTLPRLGDIARQAVPHVLEGTLIPLALFYAGFHLFGFTVAIIVTLSWAYLAVATRVLRRRPVPGVLLISALMLTARSAMGLLSGSAFLYFIQPAIGGALLAAAFGFSVLVRRPLAERLARDLVPLPDHVLRAPWIGGFFVRITLFWAGVFAANAALSVWLLTTSSVGAFVIGRTAASAGLTIVAIAASTLAFVRTARANDLAVVRA